MNAWTAKELTNIMQRIAPSYVSPDCPVDTIECSFNAQTHCDMPQVATDNRCTVTMQARSMHSLWQSQPESMCGYSFAQEEWF